MTAPDQGRKRRADAGQVRATERDVLGMFWVVEMYGMPLDLLRRLLGTSEGAVRNMIARWRRAGWAESGKVDAGPMWVWATRLGAERFGRYPYAYNVPGASRTPHIRAVIRTRMALEAGTSEPYWRSERELRYVEGTAVGAPGQRRHFADGELEYSDSQGNRLRLLVEVEITPKPFERVKSIMTQVLTAAGRGGQVLYMVNARTRPLVERARNEMGARAADVLIRDIPDEGAR